MNEVIYLPDSGRERYRRLLQQMKQDLAASPRVARQLLARQLQGEYRQTLLGGVLAFLPALALVLWAVLAERARILSGGVTEIPYAAFVLLGLVLWQTFVDSIQIQIETLDRERALLTKVDLPPESLILAGLGRVFVHLGPKLLLVALAFALLRQGVGWTLLAAPLPLLALVLLGTALGLFLAPLHALYHDVGKSLQAVLTLWFFVTPVLYAVPAQGLFRRLLELNPVTPLLGLARDLATTGSPESWPPALWMTGGTLVALPLAWFFYRLALPVVLEKSQ